MNDLQEILSTTADRAEDLLRMAVAASRAGFDELVEATRVPLAFAGIEPTDTNAMLAVGAAGLVAVFVLFRLYRLVVRRRAVLPSATLEAMTRYPRRLGIAAVALFVLVFIGWSALAPLASAALAPGIISPDGYRKNRSTPRRRHYPVNPCARRREGRGRRSADLSRQYAGQGA
ncbi:hypothetical protein QW131_31535 [Roseibium salinum]|nr:hypothetical protein [Roseibium salinum]